MTAGPAEVLAALGRRGETLATAESLTGGLIGAGLTEVPGASLVYRGGLIVYATDLKQLLAGVTAETLSAWGPVSARTAAELACGVRARCGADWGLAVTGVAGPDAQDGHPVGQVFVAVSGADGVHTRELALAGGRRTVREATVVEALSYLAELVGGAPSGTRGGGGVVGAGG